MGVDSSALAPVDTWTKQLFPPESGTPVLAADVIAGEQMLLNRTHCLSQNIQILEPLWLSNWAAGAPTWTQSNTGNAEQVTAGAAIGLSLDLTHGRTVTSVAMYLIGANHAAFPGGQPTMPTLRLFEFDIATGFTNSISATINDPSATDTEYEAVHVIQIGSLAVVVDRVTKRYFVTLTGEAAPNFVAGLIAFGVQVQYDS